jgi:hypothetical protein
VKLLESGHGVCQHPAATVALGDLMENDSIRASGSNTVVDIWIDGKLRSICITHEAIGAFLGFDQATEVGEDGRCDFVRKNLSLVVTSAKTRLRLTDPDAETIILDAGHLPRPDGRVGDRRKVDRRKGERRKENKPIDHPDRRRGDRRSGQRRTRSQKRD